MQATYLQNRTDITTLGKKSAQEALLGNAPNHSNLGILWSAAYESSHKKSRASKFDKKAKVGVYLSSKDTMFRIHISSSQNVAATKTPYLIKECFRKQILRPATVCTS